MPKRRAIVTIVNEPDSIPFANRAETADYVATMSSELADMARTSGLTLVAELLKLTAAEASRVNQFGHLAACRQNAANTDTP